jgi:hypothetical protein
LLLLNWVFNQCKSIWLCCTIYDTAFQCSIGFFTCLQHIWYAIFIVHHILGVVVQTNEDRRPPGARCATIKFYFQENNENSVGDTEVQFRDTYGPKSQEANDLYFLWECNRWPCGHGNQARRQQTSLHAYLCSRRTPVYLLTANQTWMTFWLTSVMQMLTAWGICCSSEKAFYAVNICVAEVNQKVIQV